MEVVTSGQTWVGFRWTEPVGFADNLGGWSESRFGVKGHLKVSILGSRYSAVLRCWVWFLGKPQGKRGQSHESTSISHT